MNNHMEPLIRECQSSRIPEEFPDSLPLLEEFRKIKIIDKKFLDSPTVLFIQHHLYPFIGRLKCMQQDGMKPGKTWFIDIPYSSNKDVLEKVDAEYTSHGFPEFYTDPLEDYTWFQLERVKSVIREIIETRPEKLLVVDDGAYFIRALVGLYAKGETGLEHLFRRTFVVEQTTRGHRYLEDIKYNCIIDILDIAVVSIARCRAKLQIESPFIGVACNNAIKENITIQESLSRKGKKKDEQIHIGIIGYGSIGASVFQALKEILVPPYLIDIIEIDVKKWPEIEFRGGIPRVELSDERYDILFGCTGYKSFGWRDRFRIKRDGILVSVSSASIEFSRSNYIEFAQLYPDDDIEIIPIEPGKGIHSDLLFTYKREKNRFTFLNSGFPVNFTGKKECLPLKFIQPTHALLYAASYQVLNKPEKGLHKISSEYDNWIYYNAFAFS